MISILFILIAWLVQMPLWLSIVITVYNGLRLACKIGKAIADTAAKQKEEEIKQKLHDKFLKGDK